MSENRAVGNRDGGESRDVYDLLDDWCGEHFDTMVARRLTGMSQDQAESLWVAYEQWSREAALPAVRPGECRPYVRHLNLWERIPLTRRDVEARIRVPMLYAHRVAIESHLSFRLNLWAHQGSPLFRLAALKELALLADLRELAEVGAIVWLDSQSRWFSEAARDRPMLFDPMGFFALDLELNPRIPDDKLNWEGLGVTVSWAEIEGAVRHLRVLGVAGQDCERWLASSGSSRQRPPAQVWIKMAQYDVLGQMTWVEALAATLHFSTPVAEAVFERIFEMQRVAGSGRTMTADPVLGRLAAIVVPQDMTLTVQEMVALRKGSNAFDEWRSQLRVALASLDALPADQAEWRRAAALQLREHLAPAASGIEREVARSTLLSAARGGLGAFTVSAIGTTAALTAGGHLLPSLVSGSAAGVAGAIREYLKGRAAQRRKQAVLSHYTSVVRALPE
jgi:hypothetical protein